jgi:hypothetical protein
MVNASELRMSIVVGIVALTLSVSVLVERIGAQNTSPTISQEEAQILVYLIPEAHTLRASGMDVFESIESSEDHREPDSFVFWVTNSNREGVQGSVTVDYFYVNKYTAEIWSFGLEKYVTSPEIAGVQAIIHKAHGITPSMVKEYNSHHPRTKNP